jgi:HNH endonuclease
MSQRKTLTEKERDTILRESGYRCAAPGCNTILAIDIHHIVEVFKGGGNDFSNLLALCPTCHALYHRGEITQESIKHWKGRLVALNQVVDVQAEIDKRIQEALTRQGAVRSKGEQREGFALAAGEFLGRTCEMGFVYAGKRFVPTGYCCFVAPKLAITTAEVVDYASEIGALRGGSPMILTRRGLASFTVRERFDIGNLVAIEMGEIDDHRIIEKLKGQGDEMANMFSEPIQSPVRFRIAPFFGERVGFLHSPRNSREYRLRSEFQFDSADVAFNMTLKSKEDFLQYVLTPVLSHIQDRGSPVFTAEGRLVGVLRETILLEGEHARRPVISGVIVLKRLLKT